MIAVQPANSPSYAGAIIFLALALFVFSLTVLCLVEAWTLWKGYAPITAFVRSDIDHHRVITTAVLLFVGALAGHFWR